MVRNPLCHVRNAPWAPTRIFQIRSASRRHLCLCCIATGAWRPLGRFPSSPAPYVRRLAIERYVQTTSKCPTSFGGRLAQIRAIQAWNSERRAWSSAEEFCRANVPRQAPSIKRAPSSRAVFARGKRAGGEGLEDFPKNFAEKFFGKSPSYSRRGLQINCNKRGI